MATLTALSLTPWGHRAEEETALKDVLARVNLERGHFRTITEGSLQEEVAGDGALELSESEDEEEDEEKADGRPAKGKPTTRQELFNAKLEMLQHVGAAEQDILMALDFISLLLSKDAPGPANATISPALRQVVPVGTLGTDVWERMPQDKARQAQDELLAANVRMESLQQSADILLSAANRLQDNVRKETQYWDEILSISEKGWNVCRIPGQQHRLGVTFGFSESSPEFSRRGIAALNVGSDGSVTLDRGFGAKPKALRVLLRNGGAIFGSSKIPSVPEDRERTLEARIRYARDSLFDEELYHEMVRESRLQASIGVSMKGNAIIFKPSQERAANATEVLFELISLDEDHTPQAESHSQNDAAQAIAIAARLLLTQAHRERLKKRSQVPPPLSEKKDERAVLPILRPVMSFVLHQYAQDEVNAYLNRATAILSAADITNTCERAGFSLADSARLSTAESLVTKFMQTWVSDATLTVTAEDKMPFGIQIHLETSLSYDIGTTFVLTFPGSRAFRFSLFDELRETVDNAVASALAKALASFAGDGWRCNEREALLTKVGDDVGKSTDHWVTLDGGIGTLSLSSPISKASWKAEGESEERSMWAAFGEMLR
ncbi:hypothetical protein LTR36_000478 [Oleoguttula mirabilis]|uniref:Mediator of RNA polymerase II transcription subunit 17 n=1 Tax=Oleoguttula mirabilis TaxID=1507867 RepID=A0AAV9JQ49_9PEZI|nr:hypothetical protein LTR36_000478 [Oleoguttula mirabilis]